MVSLSLEVLLSVFFGVNSFLNPTPKPLKPSILRRIMMKHNWEYRNHTGSWTELCRVMNLWGEDSWEMVSMVAFEAGNRPHQFYCVFKRPLNNAKLPIEVEVTNFP